MEIEDLTTEDIKVQLVKRMFEKQDELNIQTNGSDWKRNSNLKWYRAIWTECAELIDYTNWKWWKKENESIRDAQMEAIDIWHFLMSTLLVSHNYDYNNIINLFEMSVPNFETVEKHLDKIRNETEELVETTLLRNYHLSIYHFVVLCKLLNLNLEDVYKLYIGKNVLNKFRQNNGYKQKTYKKIWDGEEDNVYLMNKIDQLQITDKFENEVYELLEKKYTTI